MNAAKEYSRQKNHFPRVAQLDSKTKELQAKTRQHLKELDDIIEAVQAGTFIEHCRNKEIKDKDLLGILRDTPKIKAKTPDGLTVKEVIKSRGDGIPLLNGFVQANQRQNRRR